MRIQHPELYETLESLLCPFGSSAAQRREVASACLQLAQFQNVTPAEIRKRYHKLLQIAPERVGDIRAFVRAWHTLSDNQRLFWPDSVHRAYG